MSEATKNPETEEPQSALEFLTTLPDGPTAMQIQAWKGEVPNGRMMVVSPPPMNRVWLMRGITGLEMKKLQALVPKNTEDPDLEFKLQQVALACVWTNTTRSTKLSAEELRNSGAGLPHSMAMVVDTLSDFYDAPTLFSFAAEL